MNKMEKLPPEMIAKIAAELSAHDLVAFCGTNQKIFDSVSEDTLLWQRHIDEGNFPICSILPKYISSDSGNCPQKDEFVLQKRLHQNWRTGNFKIETVTEPIDKNFQLGCKYDDFAMWLCFISKNSWMFFWYDAEDGFHTGIYTYTVPTEEPAWMIPEWSIDYVGAVSRKLIILHLRFYHGANELLALDISKPDEITAVWRTGPVWQSEADISDDWKVQVINETAFVFRAPNRMPCIDFFNANNGKLKGSIVDDLLQNGYLEWFGVTQQHNREVLQKQDFFSIGWHYNIGHRTELFSFDVTTKQLQPVECDGTIARFFGFGGPVSQFGNNLVFNFRRFGKRLLRVVDLKNLSIVKDKELSTSFFILSRCQYNISQDGNFYISEANDEQTSYKFYRIGPGSDDECEIPLPFNRDNTIRLHRECFISTDVDEDNSAFISFIPFPSNTKGGITEIRRPLPHPNIQDSTFKICDLVCMPSAAIARVKNRAKSSFWMLLNFVA